jgi:CHAD domain-containing protein
MNRPAERDRADAEWPAGDDGRLVAQDGRPGTLEIELKYAVRDAAALDALLGSGRLAGYRVGRPRIASVEDRYIDTEDRALERAGYAARLRRRGDRTTIELKSLRSEDSAIEALHRREELTGPAADDLSPDRWPESPARERLVELAGGSPVAERFRLRQRRAERELSADAGTILLTVDRAEVYAGDRRVGVIGDLELELAKGDESQMESLAAALDASGAVEPEPASKFQRAAGFVEDATAHEAPSEDRADAEGAGGDAAGEAPAPPDRHERLGLSVGKTPGVQATDPLAEAGRKILRFHLARMLAREAGAHAGHDPEDLHAMRVATRRMRAAWRVFGDAYRPRRVRRSVEELRALAAALGRVRDLDVLIDGLERYIAGLPEAEAKSIAPLAEAWRNERAQGRKALIQILESDAYRRFVEDYVEFVRIEGAGVAPVVATDPQRVRDSAGSRIWSAFEHVRAYDGVLRWADIATLHQLRIAGKRLRYTVEFFREPLGPEAPMLIERVTALQDHLGLLHDADVSATLARTFLVERSAHLAPHTVDAVGRYLRSREHDVAQLRRTLTPTWRRVMSLEFRRGLARAISAL